MKRYFCTTVLFLFFLLHLTIAVPVDGKKNGVDKRANYAGHKADPGTSETSKAKNGHKSKVFAVFNVGGFEEKFNLDGMMQKNLPTIPKMDGGSVIKAVQDKVVNHFFGKNNEAETKNVSNTLLEIVQTAKVPEGENFFDKVSGSAVKVAPDVGSYLRNQVTKAGYFFPNLVSQAKDCAMRLGFMCFVPAHIFG